MVELLSRRPYVGSARSRGWLFSLFAVATLAAGVVRGLELNTNLITNPDAEIVEDGGSDPFLVPNWNTSGSFRTELYGTEGGFPGHDSPGPDQRGARFFTGGSGSMVSTAVQVYDISAAATLIDLGAIGYRTEAFLGGFSTNGDNARFTCRFLNASGAQIAAIVLGPVSNADRNNRTGLLPRSASGPVPAGTRSIEFVITMTRSSGVYNDGYADALSFSVRATDGLFSDGFEAAPTTK